MARKPQNHYLTKINIAALSNVDKQRVRKERMVRGGRYSPNGIIHMRVGSNLWGRANRE